MKNVIITGAGKGIGFALAEKFLAEGQKVIAISRNTSKLEELKTTFKNLYIIKEDITMVQNVADAIISFVTSVDILINNAGAFLKKPFEQIALSEMETVYRTNVFAPVLLVGALKNKLSDGAHIINIGSMGGVGGSEKFPGLSIYSSSKGALAILSECLQTELSDQNVAVNCLALGAVNTEMLQKAFPDYAAEVESEQLADYVYSFSMSASPVQRGQIIRLTRSNP